MLYAGLDLSRKRLDSDGRNALGFSSEGGDRVAARFRAEGVCEVGVERDRKSVV